MGNIKEILSQKDEGFKIEVENSGLLEFQFFPDPPDGSLTIASVGENVPFDVERVYWITDLGRAEAIRGRHAHRELEQIIVCVAGSFNLVLDDGVRKEAVRMVRSNFGIRLGPMLWHEMTNFSPDCVILVLASDLYDEGDYIRDYQEFLGLVREKYRF